MATDKNMIDVKWRKVIILLLAMVSVIIMTAVLASCSSADDSDDTVSEGVDTPIEVTGYTDLGSSRDHFFLEKGDKIAVISPSALPTEKQRDEVIEGLKEWGYIPVEGKYACVEERTLENCIEDLQWALEDDDIKAIFCIRGGHASCEVLDHVPLSMIRDANKPILGYSDITACLSAWTEEGVPSIHACMSRAFEDLSEESVDAEKKIITGQIPSYKCGGSEYDIQGEAEGILIGGNLATLTTVLDTAYDCTAVNEPYILFLEETEEDYEHIHRFLAILEHEGILDEAEGIIFGEWVDRPVECDTYNGNSRGGEFTSVADMISRQFLSDRDIPAAFGFPAGHADVNYPLLMGAKAKLAVNDDSFTLEWINEY